jgi:outer membrane protein assembly factor BamE (lipoprotein component of BamABCDE complex)
MRKLTLAAILLVAIAGSVAAQASIDPGMTKEQVIARLGKPASEHSKGTTTYLYYKNGQEKKMGMSDMVAIENDKVVDAVFRSSQRKYTGKSSSPAPVSAAAAIAKGNAGKAPGKLTVPPAKKAAAPVTKAPETKKAADTSNKSTPAQTKKP